MAVSRGPRARLDQCEGADVVARGAPRRLPWANGGRLRSPIQRYDDYHALFAAESVDARDLRVEWTALDAVLAAGCRRSVLGCEKKWQTIWPRQGM